MVTATGLIEVERQGDTLVLTPHGDLRELEYSEFGEDPEEVLGLLASDPTLRNLVVDFGQTGRLGPTALTLFTRLGQEVRGRDGRMAFCNFSPHEGQDLALTGLGKAWPALTSREEAIEAVVG